MAKFKNISKTKIVNSVTHEMLIPEMIDDEGRIPTLILAPAISSNKAFQRAKLSSMSKNTKQNKRLAAGGLNQKFIDAQREEDLPLLISHIIVGWKNFYDAETEEEIPFSKEEVTDFLDQIDEWLIDAIRDEAANIKNFLPESETPLDEDERADLAKN